MFKGSLDYKIIDSKSDEQGRYILMKCEIQGQKMFLINVYGPNTENEHHVFLSELIESTKHFCDEDFYHIVSGGDWNFVENINLDKKGGIQKVWEKSVRNIDKLKEHLDLVDI